MAEIGEIIVDSKIDVSQVNKKLAKIHKRMKEINEYMQHIKDTTIEVKIIYKYKYKKNHFWEFWK